MNKLLSIIVPSYNMEKYLPKCLGSLVVDDLSLLEKLDVIVVNDGSVDRTSEIAHDFATRYPSVFRVIDKPNGHYGSCINAALPTAQGKYVRLLDADDYVKTTGLKDFLLAIANVTADVIVAECVRVNPAGDEERNSTIECLPPREVVSINQLKDERFLPLSIISYNRKLFEGDWYRQLEGIQYTDCQWSAEPMLRASTMYYVPEVVSCYLIGRDGQSMNRAVRLKCIGQQMQVDLRLAQVHCAGRAAGVADGAWAYFKRLYLSELAIIYSLGIIGNDAGRYPRDILKKFDCDLNKADPIGYDEVKDCNYATIIYGRSFTFKYVQSYRNEPWFVLRSRCLIYKVYVRVRLFIGKCCKKCGFWAS